MSNNKVDDLRAILFDTIRAVKDGSMPLDRAKAVGELTQVVVNSAKVEVEFLRATNGKGKGTGFLGEQVVEPPALPGAGGAAPAGGRALQPGELPEGFVGRRTHILSDEEPEPKGDASA